MSEELISRLSTCIALADKLEKQLRDNRDSFKQCTRGDVYTAYKASNKAAVEHCRELKAMLSQLKETAQTRLLSEL